jgi:hypothetical protein
MGKIIKSSNYKRGFGSMTAAIFETINGFDYLEVVCSNNSDFQRDQQAIDNPNSLVGKTVDEIMKDPKFRVVSSHGHFHRTGFDKEGNIISLIR